MKISFSIMIGLCMAGILSLGVHAQDHTPPRKIPQLTMEDLENRTAPVPSSTPIITGGSTAPVISEKQAAGATRPVTLTNAKAALESAWKKMSNLKSVRMRLTNHSAKGVNQMLYEFASSGHMRMIRDKTEVIFTEATVFVRADGQEWKKASKAEMFGTRDLSFKSFVNGSDNKDAQVQLMGEEMLEQRPMWKFRVNGKNGSVNYTWVGKTDGWVYKMEDSVPNEGRFISMVISDHNGEISIVPPTF